MNNITNLIVGVLFAGSILAATAESVRAQDPTAVDAKHYKVEFENDRVRVLRVDYGAKERSVMHQHPEGLAIFMTESRSRFTLADGQTEDRRHKTGEVLWTPAGSHLPENLAGKPFQVILVELKVGTGGPMPAAADDAMKVAAKHHKLVLENERVRVLRGTIGPSEKTEIHGHPDNVVIFLKGGCVKSILADGKAEEAEAKAGQVAWRGPAKHVSENLSEQPIEVIVVELKGK